MNSFYTPNPMCGCAACRLRGLMGPMLLITLGILFMLQMMSYRWTFDETWPILLIVAGAVKLIQRLAPTTGHIDPLGADLTRSSGTSAPVVPGSSTPSGTARV